MKVLALAIVPPHMKVSGALRAAIELSARLQGACDIEFARLSTCNRESESPQGLPIREVRAGLPVDVVWRRLPNALRTPLYRSDLPARIAQGSLGSDCEPGAGWDLVHLHNPMPTLELRRVARACKRAGIPYVISTHGFTEMASGGASYGLGPARRVAWRLLVMNPLREVVRGAAGILGLSPADLPFLDSVGVPRERISFAPNGVPRSELHTDNDELSAVLARYEIPASDGRPRALFLGNHTANKGLPVLLEAFLTSEQPFVLIIGGSQRPAVDYAGYRERCRPGQSIVFTGLIEECDLNAIFTTSEIFVFPSLADTFPLAVLEAMEHGLPVIATRVGGIPYQVDSESGLLVEAGSVTELREAFERLASDPGKAAEMGARAQERVHQEFTWERAAELALAAYRGVLNKANRVDSPSGSLNRNFVDAVHQVDTERSQI